jgi:hypothetical protein
MASIGPLEVVVLLVLVGVPAAIVIAAVTRGD